MDKDQLYESSSFGQVVIGPPGSGKTSYCQAMAAMLTELGRKVALINLDPANDTVPYESSVSITELVKMEEGMISESLGPNAALLYCMEALSSNKDWLLSKLKSLHGCYFIFDFPGQAELYTHHTMVRDLLRCLDSANIKLCSVYLVDAHYANEPGKYLSALLVALSSMLQLESPAVNLLSKVDLVDKYEALQMPLEFYTEVLDLNYLLDQLQDCPFTKRYHKLNKAIAELVTDYSLLSFIPVSVLDKRSLLNVMKAVDKANGYIYGNKEERNIQRLLSCAVGATSEHERLGEVRDKYQGGGHSDASEEDDEEERLLKAYATQNPNVK
ncbi:GPN-loop GTPase [Trinorchestia longiramus]|nr:GPN-loop GTPase [Trinorchestia longiramus]